jgi:hypothetical protein
MPDQKLRFPFLNIEFKSQAENRTHYIATNQAAGVNAIALNGNLKRGFGAEKFDFNESQFFSVTMDHAVAGSIRGHNWTAYRTGTQFG